MTIGGYGPAREAPSGSLRTTRCDEDGCSADTSPIDLFCEHGTYLGIHTSGWIRVGVFIAACALFYWAAAEETLLPIFFVYAPAICITVGQSLRSYEVGALCAGLVACASIALAVFIRYDLLDYRRTILVCVVILIVIATLIAIAEVQPLQFAIDEAIVVSLTVVSPGLAGIGWAIWIFRAATDRRPGEAGAILLIAAGIVVVLALLTAMMSGIAKAMRGVLFEPYVSFRFSGVYRPRPATAYRTPTGPFASIERALFQFSLTLGRQCRRAAHVIAVIFDNFLVFAENLGLIAVAAAKSAFRLLLMATTVIWDSLQTAGAVAAVSVGVPICVAFSYDAAAVTNEYLVFGQTSVLAALFGDFVFVVITIAVMIWLASDVGLWEVARSIARTITWTAPWLIFLTATGGVLLFLPAFVGVKHISVGWVTWSCLALAALGLLAPRIRLPRTRSTPL